MYVLLATSIETLSTDAYGHILNLECKSNLVGGMPDLVRDGVDTDDDSDDDKVSKNNNTPPCDFFIRSTRELKIQPGRCCSRPGR